MRMTLREVLDLPPLARGRPRVRSGAGALDTEVRWVHVSELANVAGTLSGGELILSIGVVLAEPGTDLVRYLDSLCDSGAEALVVELGRHVDRLPDELVQAARARGFPLVELQATVRFVEITQAVHARVMHEQYEQLSLSHRVHRTLGSLGVEGASTDVILRRCVELIARPVVLEDLAHRVIAFAGDFPTEEILRDWSARSRQVPGGSETVRGGPERWVASPVGARRGRWGRLVVPTRIDREQLDDVTLVLERAAEAVTITHLVSGSAQDLEVAAAERLIQDVLSGHAADDVAVRSRALALGFATSGSIAVVMARSREDDDGSDAGLVDRFGRAAKRLQPTALVGRVRPHLVVGLFDASAEGADEWIPDRLVADLGTGVVGVLAIGPPVRSWRELPSLLTETERIASVAPPALPGRAPEVVRGRDLGVRSLLWQIRDDSRLHAFIDGQLGPVLSLPAARREEILGLLETYLRHNGVMAAFARAVHLSRAAAYSRLSSLERQLEADLADAEVRLGLHLALIAYRQEHRLG